MPDALDRADRLRRAPRAAAALLALGWVVGACLLGTGDARADETRFLPWEAGTTPSLHLPDLGGWPHTIADYRGRVVLVNFWATWCEFCAEELAGITKLQARLAGRPLSVLLVNYGESRAKVLAYAKHISADVRVLVDPDQDAARAWRVRVIPSSFLVDVEGVVRYRIIGHLDWDSEESLHTVRSLMP